MKFCSSHVWNNVAETKRQKEGLQGWSKVWKILYKEQWSWESSVWKKRQLKEDLVEAYKIPHGIFTSSSKTRSGIYQNNRIRARLEKEMKEGSSLCNTMLFMFTKNIITSLSCGNLKTRGFWVLGDSILALFLLFLQQILMVIGGDKLSDHQRPLSLVKHTFIATNQKSVNIMNQDFM